MLPRIAGVPGVQYAGLTNSIPLDSLDVGGGFRLDTADVRGWSAGYRVVSADYLRALGVPLVRGRFISDADDGSQQAVAVVNQEFVQQYLGEGDPIGRRFQYRGMDGQGRTMADDRGRRRQPAPSVAHDGRQAGGVRRATSSSEENTNSIIVAVRLAQRRPRRAFRAGLADTVRPLGPDVPVEIVSMEARMPASVADRRFTAAVFGSFAVAALLLAAVGIYGVLSQTVARRMHEIGIRWPSAPTSRRRAHGAHGRAEAGGGGHRHRRRSARSASARYITTMLYERRAGGSAQLRARGGGVASASPGSPRRSRPAARRRSIRIVVLRAE